VTLSETPRYVLNHPLFISTRLLPAVKIGDGTLSTECHAIETDGRTHWRFHLDVPGHHEWTSEDSFVTIIESTWSAGAARALETFCDYFGCEDSGTDIADTLLDPDLIRWVRDLHIDFFFLHEELDEWATRARA